MAYSVHPVDVATDRERILTVWDDHDKGAFGPKFQWIYRDNPAGPAGVWILRDDASGTDVGVSAVFPRLFRWRGRSVRAGIAGDLHVQEGHRRAGPALQLERAVVQGAWARGIEFMYGFPNALAEPVMKRIGFRPLGPRARYVKVLRTGDYLGRGGAPAVFTRPLGLVLDQCMKGWDRLARGNPPAGLETGPLPGFDDRFDALWAETSGAYPVIGERDARHLRWRYAAAGGESHGIFGLWDRRSSGLRGYVVHRAQGNSLEIRDALAPPDPAIWGALLAGFSAWARGQKALSLIWTTLQDSKLERLCLRRAGFHRRADPLYVFAAPGPRLASTDPDFLNSTLWTVFQSDDDCP